MEEEGLGKIEIDPKNKGTFTKYCKSIGEGSVTQKCIDKGKASSNKTTNKRAVFAENAKSFKH